ncbi:MAG: S9 family peptidase [Alkalimonas sp.]|nr:S9 family peptidase [Alkalimonas sp.]
MLLHTPLFRGLLAVCLLLILPLVHAGLPHFSAEDIFELEFASDVQISPDGQHIVYVRNSNNIKADNTLQRLWILDTSTGQHWPLLDDEHQYSQPRWAPDSNRIAFVSNRSGSEQIHVHWLSQRRTARISNLTQRPEQLSWSPDGQQLAFLMEVPAETTDFARSVYRPTMPEGAEWAEKPVIVERTYYQQDGRGLLNSAYHQVFVVPATGGTARQLTDGPYLHQGPLAWAPDSQHLVFSANRTTEWEYQPRQRDLYQLRLKDNRITPLVQGDGQHYHPVFSPDGLQLAYLFASAEPVAYRNSKLKVLDLRSNQVMPLLAELDRSVEQPVWQDNQQLVFQYEDRGLTKVARVTLRNRMADLVSDLSGANSGRPYLSGMFSLSDKGQLAYTRGSSQRLADVAIWQHGQVRNLTRLNEDLLGQRQLGKVHEFTYRSKLDDEEIHAWYITPPGFDPEKKYPLILEIHGGPHLPYGPHFSAELQRYAAEGYVVLYNNYRGSISYGERFALLLQNKYASTDDFADHMSGVDAMIAKGFIDENNLFIAGGSAGGIATAYAIGLTDRFNAAAATNPVINWVSKVLTADSYMAQIQNQFPGMPWEHLDHYWQRSPLSLVGNVSTPTLLFTGELDRRTPMAETEQFYQALRLRQIDTAMVRVPGAAHAVSNRPSRMIAKTEHTLAWFARYRKE